MLRQGLCLLVLTMIACNEGRDQRPQKGEAEPERRVVSFDPNSLAATVDPDGAYDNGVARCSARTRGRPAMSPEIVARREELRRLLRQRPFQPFRVHVTDGRTFDITHPDWNMVMNRALTIGLPEAGDKPEYPHRLLDVGWDMIAQVEMLPASQRSA
jgi:hypothetical protein